MKKAAHCCFFAFLMLAMMLLCSCGTTPSFQDVFENGEPEKAAAIFKKYISEDTNATNEIEAYLEAYLSDAFYSFCTGEKTDDAMDQILYEVETVNRKIGGLVDSILEQTEENFEKICDTKGAVDTSGRTRGCFVCDDGTLEWRDPPMELNTEYRTTERWMGEVVYTKLVDCGVGIPGESTHVSHEADANHILRYAGSMGDIALPYIYGSSFELGFAITTTKIYVTLPENSGSNTVYVQIWYTKA